MLLGEDGQTSVAVGDWVLVENDAPRVLRILERRSLIARLAAGVADRMQLIAANVDTLFVVTSCNHDFNLSRLERYLAVAHEAGVEPLIVLTKIDLCADSERYVADALDPRAFADRGAGRDFPGHSSGLAAMARRGTDRHVRRILWCGQIDARQHTARRGRSVHGERP